MDQKKTAANYSIYPQAFKNECNTTRKLERRKNKHPKEKDSSLLTFEHCLSVYTNVCSFASIVKLELESTDEFRSYHHNMLQHSTTMRVCVIFVSFALFRSVTGFCLVAHTHMVLWWYYYCGAVRCWCCCCYCCRHYTLALVVSSSPLLLNSACCFCCFYTPKIKNKKPPCCSPVYPYCQLVCTVAVEKTSIPRNKNCYSIVIVMVIHIIFFFIRSFIRNFHLFSL